VWSWVASFFSSKKNVERVVDTASFGFTKVIEGFDHITFAPEEQAAYMLERIKQASTDTDARAVSRRILAWGVMGIAVFLTLLITFCIMMEWKARQDDLTILLNFWATPLSVVLGFYFFYYGVQKIVTGRKKDE
jgi:hypothetical protein